MARPTNRQTRYVVLTAAVFLAGCRGTEEYQKPLTPVRIVDVGRRPIGRSLRYSATIEPQTRVDLAFKVGGYVETLASINGRPIQDGDRVTRNIALASLRTADYDAKVSQARSQVAEAEAGNVQARQALDRATALLATRSLTKPDMEQAQGAYDSVQAKLAGARALVLEAENARADSVLRAPLDAIVLKRLVEVGSLVGPGTPGFVLADTRTVKVIVGLPDAVLPAMTMGTVVSIETEALASRRFSGRVTRVSPAADPRSRVFEVEVSLPNPDGALKPGMVASVDLSATQGQVADALVLPLSAIVRSPKNRDGFALFVVEDRDGRPIARQREVRLGELVGNGIEVADGIRPGERVIVSGATIVVDGEPVNPTR